MPVLSQDLTIREIAERLTPKGIEALRHIGTGVMRSDTPHASAPIRAHIGGRTKTYTAAAVQFQELDLAQRDGVQWSLTDAGNELLRRIRGAL